MKKLIILSLFAVSIFGADPFRNLGSITASNFIGWTANPETNIAGYNIYLSATNQTNFLKVATVTTNVWAGDSTKNWFGPKLLNFTAIATNSIMSVESDPSETVIVTFRAGVPIPPTNIQLYSLLTASATNALTIPK